MTTMIPRIKEEALELQFRVSQWRIQVRRRLHLMSLFFPQLADRTLQNIHRQNFATALAVTRRARKGLRTTATTTATSYFHTVRQHSRIGGTR